MGRPLGEVRSALPRAEHEGCTGRFPAAIPVPGLRWHTADRRANSSSGAGSDLSPPVVFAFAGAFGGKSTTPVNGYQHRLKRSTCSSAKSPTLSASAPSGTKSSIKVSALLSRPSRLFLAVSRSLLA